jgi:Trk K+ transport system NAD-binding subunit
MHIIIVGGGEIGFSLAQTLASEHAVVVVDALDSVAARFEPASRIS